MIYFDYKYLHPIAPKTIKNGWYFLLFDRNKCVEGGIKHIREIGYKNSFGKGLGHASYQSICVFNENGQPIQEAFIHFDGKLELFNRYEYNSNNDLDHISTKNGWYRLFYHGPGKLDFVQYDYTQDDVKFEGTFKFFELPYNRGTEILNYSNDGELIESHILRITNYKAVIFPSRINEETVIATFLYWSKKTKRELEKAFEQPFILDHLTSKNFIDKNLPEVPGNDVLFEEHGWDGLEERGIIIRRNMKSDLRHRREREYLVKEVHYEDGYVTDDVFQNEITINQSFKF